MFVTSKALYVLVQMEKVLVLTLVVAVKECTSTNEAWPDTSATSAAPNSSSLALSVLTGPNNAAISTLTQHSDTALSHYRDNNSTFKFCNPPPSLPPNLSRMLGVVCIQY